MEATTLDPEASKIQGAVAQLEAVIANVRNGSTEASIDVDFPPEHPIGALAVAVSEAMAALHVSKRARELQEIELEDRVRMIREQQAAILELSSPVIEVWRGVLTLPIVGTVDAERATAMTTNLLESVSRARAQLAIIDVTGVHGVAADVCDHILRMARCVRLLGAECAISGMRADVARTITELGYDLGQVKSYPTLRAALTHHVRTRLRERSKPAEASTAPRWPAR